VIWITAVATAMGLAILIFGVWNPIREPVSENPLLDRVAFYSSAAGSALDDELEQMSFYERMIQPRLAQFSAAIAERTPSVALAALESNLEAAGRPYGLTAEAFIAVRVAGAVWGAGLGALLGYAVGGALLGATALSMVLIATVGAVAGWLGLGAWLQRAIANRRKAMARSLPEVVDFLVVAVDAGLNFDAALSRVVERFDNPLTAGFRTALAEVSLGRHRLEALEDFGHRAELPELNSFISMIVSSERMGVPIAQTLRIQSQDLRRRRADTAAELAARAPIKMTIPMVALIFPTLWLILLGPSVLRLLAGGGL
jgi:tight adherence protein C